MSREIKQSKIEKDGKTVIVNKIDGAIVPNVTNTSESSSSTSSSSVAGGTPTTPIPVSTPTVAQPTTTNNNGIPKTKIKDGLVPNITAQSELPEVTENTNVPSISSSVNVVSGASIPTTDEEIEKKRLRSKLGVYDQNKIKDGIIPLITAAQVNPPNIPPQILPPDTNQFTAFVSALAETPEPLSIFVPYIGALKDVDLGPQSLIAGGCVTAGCLSDGTVTLTGGVFDVFPQTPIAAPFAQYDIANKKYVDDSVSASDTFLELTDTIGSFTATRLLYESDAAVVDSASLTFDGTTLVATALSSGAITGTSFIIGANTLTTTEWAFLDGLDQSVSSGASPTFTGTNITAVASITAADESADTTCFPAFFTAATGTVSAKTGTNLTFNSATGLLTATALSSGAITGTSFIIGANTLTTTEWAFLDGLDQSVSSGASPTFTGTNITAVASITAADESADTTCFPAFFTAATGTVSAKTGTNLTFNSATGLLTATALSDGTATLTGGDLTGLTSLVVDNITIDAATITSGTGTISFNDDNLTTTGIAGASSLDLGVAAATTGILKMHGSTSGTVTIQSAAAAGTYTLTLPLDDGGASEFLQTDGDGVLTWASGVTFGTDNQIPYVNAAGNDFDYSANLTFVHATSTLTVDGDITATGTLTSTDGTTGQSLITSGLIVNNDNGSTSTDDFRAATTSVSTAFVVDASADTVNTNTGRIVKTNRLTSNTALTAQYDQVFCNTDGGIFIVTLPAGVNGTRYRIINTGSNNLTITPAEGESLLGSASSFTLATDEALTIVYESTEGWY